MKLYKEWTSIKIRFIVMLILMIIAAIAIAALKNFAVNMLNSPQVQAYLKGSNAAMSNLLKKISTDFTYYSYTQWFGKNYQQLAALVAIIFSFSTFSKERERGTIYLIFGRMNRGEIYVSKMFVGYLSLLTVTFAGGMTYFLTALLLDYQMSFSMAMNWTVTSMVGVALLYQIGTYMSLIFKDQIKPFLFDILIYVGFYLCGIFKPTKFLNIFGYMADSNILHGYGLNVLSTFVILGVCSAIFVGEYYQFKFMDL